MNVLNIPPPTAAPISAAELQPFARDLPMYFGALRLTVAGNALTAQPIVDGQPGPVSVLVHVGNRTFDTPDGSMRVIFTDTHVEVQNSGLSLFAR